MFFVSSRMYASCGKIKYVTFVVYLFKLFFVSIFLCKHFAFQYILAYTFRHAIIQSRDIIDWYVVLIRTKNVIGPYFATVLCVSWNHNPFWA